MVCNIKILWYFNGMKTTIDRGGRVVIPKVLRERAGLKPGMEVEVRLMDGNIEIRPAESHGQLVRKEGFLVWEPGPGAPAITVDDVNRAIHEVREEREERIISGALGLEDRS